MTCSPVLIGLDRTSPDNINLLWRSFCQPETSGSGCIIRNFLVIFLITVWKWVCNRSVFFHFLLLLIMYVNFNAFKCSLFLRLITCWLIRSATTYELRYCHYYYDYYYSVVLQYLTPASLSLPYHKTRRLLPPGDRDWHHILEIFHIILTAVIEIMDKQTLLNFV